MRGVECKGGERGGNGDCVGREGEMGEVKRL